MSVNSTFKRIWYSNAFKRVVLFITMGFICIGIAHFMLTREPAHSAEVKEAAEQKGVPVTVQTVAPVAYPSMISVLGEVRPVWECQVKAQVEGPIDDVSDWLRVGYIVTNGQWLIKFDSSAYEMQVAEAASQLAAAEVTLLREEEEAKEAVASWERSGMQGEPSSLLALRGPQLREAGANFEAAQKALARAQKLLSETTLCAPFNGLIVERNVSKGDTLFLGDVVATLYGIARFEITVHLNAEQWTMLPSDFSKTHVVLRNMEQHGIWTANVTRVSGHLDRGSRLRTLYLSVENPLDCSPPLLPGTFVRATLTGRTIPNLLRIPEASLTKRSEIWYMDSTECLAHFRADPVFYEDGFVYVRAPEHTEQPMQIALRPNGSFTTGLRIQPLHESEEGQ